MNFIITIGVSSLIAAIVTIVCFLFFKAMVKKNAVREKEQTAETLENNKDKQFRNELKNELNESKKDLAKLNKSQIELHNRLEELHKKVDDLSESVQSKLSFLLQENECLIKSLKADIQKPLEKMAMLENDIHSLNEKWNQSMSKVYDKSVCKNEEKNKRKEMEEKPMKLEQYDSDKLRYFKVEEGRLKETQNEKALFVWKLNPYGGNEISYQFNELCNKYEACNKRSELTPFCEIIDEEQGANAVKATDEWGKAKYCNGKVEIDSTQKAKIRFIKE